MMIDSYIRHLELQKKGLTSKATSYLKDGDKKYLKEKEDPHFYELQETREKIKQVNSKLDFLRNLRKELLNNEMQDQKNRKR